MSLTLFNKLVNIINDRPLDNTQTISGGVMLNETIDNLVGGSQLNENNKGQSTPIVPKELNENLFEGGNNAGDNNAGDNNTGDTDDNYTMFLHRLKTKELYTDACKGVGSSDACIRSAHTTGCKGMDTNAVSGGKTPKEVNNDETTNIDVLPMFPYLVRY